VRGTTLRADRVERLLHTLAGEGVFRALPDGRFENTPLSDALRAGVAGSQRAMVLMTGEQQFDSWRSFHACLSSDRTAFEHRFGQPIFGWYAQHPAEAATFNEAMLAMSSAQVPALAAAYDPSRATTIVDVGGGHGMLLEALMARAPRARGVVFDLPQGLEAARARGFERDPHVELVAGDFFREVYRGGDLYVLKFVLHDWSDAQSAAILRNVAAAMAPGGRVLVCEMIVGAPNQPDPARWLDLQMMAQVGGRERTQAEFESLFSAAGLRLIQAVPTACGLSLLEAERA
jgi:SAM-dependent methyltransferase